MYLVLLWNQDQDAVSSGEPQQQARRSLQHLQFSQAVAGPQPFLMPIKPFRLAYAPSIGMFRELCGSDDTA
jgi:hypothetical protein